MIKSSLYSGNGKKSHGSTPSHLPYASPPANFPAFYNCLLVLLFTGMLFISLTSPRNLWLADISKKTLEGNIGRRGRALSTIISTSIGLLSVASVQK
jgi:hypothetical protein